jgi:hypothetical protein
VGAGWLGAGRNVTPEETGLDETFGDGRNDDVVALAGAAALGALKGEAVGVFPRITGAAALGALKGEAVGVFPRITGAAALGALKGEAADVVPRIAGAAVLEELETGAVGVFPRITGAAALGALKGEAADVVPRIAGAEGGFIPKPIFIGPVLGGLGVGVDLGAAGLPLRAK